MSLLASLLRPSFPVVPGKAVTLRLPAARDYPAWANLREESRGFLTPWEPLWSADELSKGAFRARLRRYHVEARERSSYTFLIFETGSGTLLGGITAGLIRRGVAQSCTIGYWMGARHAGRGHMADAIEALKPFLFEIQGLHRIEAACLPRNLRSIRLLEKSGFRREGYLQKYLKIAGSWEDHHLYSLLAEDWTGMRIAGSPAPHDPLPVASRAAR